jgi:hypothetical protein
MFGKKGKGKDKGKPKGAAGYDPLGVSKLKHETHVRRY